MSDSFEKFLKENNPQAPKASADEKATIWRVIQQLDEKKMFSLPALRWAPAAVALAASLVFVLKMPSQVPSNGMDLATFVGETMEFEETDFGEDWIGLMDAID